MTYLSDALTGLYDALVAALEPTPAGQPGLTITLGLAPTVAQDDQFIIVGHDGTTNPDGSLSLAAEAGTTGSVFIAMGGTPPEQERGVVHCVLVCQTGDQSDLTGRIAAAETLLTSCAAAGTDLHTAVTGGENLIFGAIGDARLYTRQSDAGCVAEWVWQWPYDAPWGS